VPFQSVPCSNSVPTAPIAAADSAGENGPLPGGWALWGGIAAVLAAAAGASNVVESRPQGTPTWTQAGITKKSRFTVPGLTSGTIYEFRVHGVGTDGNGP
jgi:hypothetical protein